MTWEIMIGLIAIVGFFITVTTPIMKLNASITRLNDSIEVLKTSLDRIDNDNEKSHGRIWEKNNAQDKMLDDHERRVSDIENTMKLAERLHPELVGLNITSKQPTDNRI